MGNVTTCIITAEDGVPKEVKELWQAVDSIRGAFMYDGKWRSPDHNHVVDWLMSLDWPRAHYYPKLRSHVMVQWCDDYTGQDDQQWGRSSDYSWNYSLILVPGDRKIPITRHDLILGPESDGPWGAVEIHNREEPSA